MRVHRLEGHPKVQVPAKEKGNTAMTRSFTIDRLRVAVFGTREDMGRCAAQQLAEALDETLTRQPECNMVFAAAPSQNEMLAALVACAGIEWQRINAFHMDEYIGLPADAPQGFANFLKTALFNKVPFRTVHCIDGAAAAPQAECERYAALLRAYPTHLACMGIGENGHLAFNDPPVADFNDPALVKCVTLDEACRRQQVHDGCFGQLSQVPRQALTLTIPALMEAGRVFCVVPGAAKAQAVRDCLKGPVDSACPASILRRHPAATLYLDADSAALL